MIFVGTKVRIKSIDKIDERFINIYSGLPIWATREMKEYYGNGRVYTVKKASIFKRTWESHPSDFIYLAENPYSWSIDDFEVVDVSSAIIPEYDLGDIVMADTTGEPLPSIITGIDQRETETYYEIDDNYCIESWRIEGKCEEGTKVPNKVYCARCEKLFVYRDEDNICEEDRELCPECRKREFITPYHAYRPKVEFHKCNKKDDDLFFGVELEVDGGGERNDYAVEAMSILNGKSRFVYCSHDGSLDDGFEIITQPATLSYHKSLEKTYREAFKKLLSRGYRSHDTSTSGIHVHFSRDYYADNEEDNIAKLLYLVEKFWDEIVVFSRRDYRTLERYAKKIDADADSFIRAWNKKDCHSGHYYAVNISNPDTIELRMFKGTLNYDTYIAIIEFVNSIVRAAKEKTIAELQQMDFKELLTPLCLEYYETRNNKFIEAPPEDKKRNENSSCNTRTEVSSEPNYWRVLSGQWSI